MYSKILQGDSKARVKLCVGLILINAENKVLLEKRSDNGMWGLIGGGVEPGETIQQTAFRESYEETGLKINALNLIGIYSDISQGRIVTYPDNGDVVHLIDIIFSAVVIAGNLRISKESVDLKYFSPFSIPDDLVPPAKQPISDFVNNKMVSIF
jgi:8-oxo-dGTP pyrophosphatase MutT (NUDIX family)